MIMGEVITPIIPQWEGEAEAQAWRKHRERQRRPLVFDPVTGTFRPEKKPENWIPIERYP